MAAFTVVAGSSAALGSEHVATLYAQAWLGVVLYDLGRLDQAAALLGPAVDELTALLGDNHAQVSKHRDHLAALETDRQADEPGDGTTR